MSSYLQKKVLFIQCLVMLSINATIHNIKVSLRYVIHNFRSYIMSIYRIVQISLNIRILSLMKLIHWIVHGFLGFGVREFS